ncbi:hypothetical protein BTO05_03730 [Winogradskyella sp. PC-19]|uniref:hypothetical protein n=1 Tax=unclassified Winogradskyella TaxID=2615021 RepID=UPI000B3CA5C7|nr:MULTISPECIES: hypothetical protein [unclassified Winogradskyella]ARV08790.1 hypothetical protein BTO05_03730 [Winogradskyella sp. PC-19]
MKTILLCFNLFIFAVCTAQEHEYLVTKKGDTIYGKVTRATSFLNPSKIKFKAINGDKKTLLPEDVETIKSLKCVDGQSIIKTIYDEWYIRLVIDGRIKVYQLLDGVIFYTSKDGSKIRLNDFVDLMAERNPI